MTSPDVVRDALTRTGHRPWPAPRRGWSVAMRWHELLFLHWPVDAAMLRPVVPAALEIDTFAGQAWLGVIPFRMSGIRARGLPALPGLSAFAELNVRTYVRVGGKPGVWFFSLDAASRLAVRVARWTHRLPYFDARMQCERGGDGWVNYDSERTHRDAAPARFAGRYRPVGEVGCVSPGSLEHFLYERYCLYSVDRRGRPWRGDIHHPPWSIQTAKWRIDELAMTASLGVTLDGEPAVAHYADQLDVVAWTLSGVESTP